MQTSMKIQKILASLVFFAAISGCQLNNQMMSALNPNASKFDQSYLKQSIVIGKTTKTNIRQMFGAPSSESSNSSTSEWVYEKTQGGPNLDKYIALANKYASKYASSETKAKIHEASANASDAQGAMNDATDIVGADAMSSNSPGTKLKIEFSDDVVKNYSLY